MGWIKKGNLIALGAALFLTWAFFLFCFDGLLRRGLIGAGQAAAGAKVEVGSLRTRLIAGRLTLRNVAVADKNDPMKNLFEFSGADFALKPSALLRGKVVIPESSLSGLKMGTPRKTSGALRQAPPSALESALRRKLAAPATAALGDVKTNAAAQIEAAKLSSVNKVEETRDRLRQTSEKWKSRGAELKNLEQDVQKTVAELKSVKMSGSPVSIASDLRKIKEGQERLRGFLKEVGTLKKDLETDVSAVKSALAEAERLKNADLNGLMAAAGLPSLDAKSLGLRLLGPGFSQKLSTAMGWANWAKAKAASQARARAEPPPRRRGLTVEFPVSGSDPGFLLEKAALSGSAAGLFGGKDMDLSGVLSGVTSNPKLYGKPARLKLDGSVKNGPRLKLHAALDAAKPETSVSLDFAYSGLPLAGTLLGDDEIGATIDNGAADVSGQLKLEGDYWRGTVDLQARDVDLKPRLKLSGPARDFAAAALREIRRFGARLSIEGRAEDLRLDLSTDLGAALAEGFKRGVSQAALAQRRILEAKLNALYAEKAKGLESEIAKLQESWAAPLKKQEAFIAQALQSALAKPLGNPLKNLDKLFR